MTNSARFAATFVAAALLVVSATSCDPAPPVMGEICTPGQGRCSANAYETCAGDGARWIVAQDCAAVGELCVQNLGCRVCFPDQVTCGGDGFEVVRCGPEGEGYTTLSRCEPLDGDLCVGGECVNACAHAVATRSYEGCEYIAADLDNAVVSNQGTASAQQFSIVVSNPLELPAHVTVEVDDAPPGMPAQLRIVAEADLARVVGGGDLATINLDPRELDCSTDPHLNDGSHTCLSSNAFRVRSTAPIVAYQFNPLENVGVFSNDASLLLPITALDVDYMVIGWPQTLALTDDPATNGTIDLRSFLTIIAIEEDTHVQVQLAADIIGSADIPAGRKGDTIELTIGAYDVLNLETDGFNADFTGSVVHASKPVAVFSGSEAADVPFFDTWGERECCADHLEEQLFPQSALGTQFVATKTPLRTQYVEQAGWNVALVSDEPEYWRLVATTEDTSISTNLPPPNDSFLLGRGQSVTFVSERDFVVNASDPVSFAQFPASQQTTGIPSVSSGGEGPPGGDPSMILVPPVQQWRDKYVFLVPNKYAFDFLLISAPASTTIRYDGLDLETVLDRCEYEPIGKLPSLSGDVEYQAIRCPLSDPNPDNPSDPSFQDDGRHTLESADGQPFGLVLYGWDRYVSYGYPGGTNVEIINPG